MFDAFDLENKLKTLQELIAEFENTILTKQANVAYKFIRSDMSNKFKYIKQYQNEIEEYLRIHRRYINLEIYDMTSEVSKLFLQHDFETYMKAYNLNLIAVKPTLSKMNKAILAQSIRSQQIYVNNVISEITFNSEKSISNILEKNIKALKAGQTKREMLKNTAQQIMETGIDITDSAGRHISDVTAFINKQVKFADSELFSQQQEQLIDDMKIPADEKYMETSSHAGARPDHAKWQGLVLPYDEYIERCQPNTPTGIYGYNCRHRAYVYVKGVSTRVFEHYNEAENKVQYEQQQHQRHLEAQVRKWKQKDSVYTEMKIDTTETKAKVAEYQGKLRQYTKETGLKRQYQREAI